MILFGSLARGDYMEQSDADFCIVLPADPETLFSGSDRAVALDPSGAVQPVVYGAEQFRRMVEQANGLAPNESGSPRPSGCVTFSGAAA